MESVRIDGSMGEGGGQVLRTALTLALLKQVKVEVFNIRAKRNKPGLLRQHLTCVRAARDICDGLIDGDELGSQRIVLTPNKVKAGDYHFVIGTAGSTSLVCQTVLLPLALAGGQSKVTFEGGTHNGMSPSVTFLQEAFLPLLEKMGVKTRVEVDALGFYPAGGGKWSLHIDPCESLKPLDIDELKGSQTSEHGLLEDRLSVTAMISHLPVNIAQRETETVAKRLKLKSDIGKIREVSTPGPGNSLIISYRQNGFSNVFEVVGEVSISAERVAKRAAGRLLKLFNDDVIVDDYLADQLMLPMAVAGGGSYTTTKPSLHSSTNAEVIKLFGIHGLKIEQVNKVWRFSLT
ncbi:RNA 3'-terminal phosphate cyclase [Alteromonadaceae bacterium M269]|nr:RNA 3'-terminal phosphate cyclase [Alteromonadaceae bacterium M269]